MKLVLPKGWWHEADAFSLRVNDPSGRELWTWVWDGGKADSQASFIADASSAKAGTPNHGKPSAVENDEEVVVKADELTMRISKRTGFLAGVQRGAQTFSLTNGPRPA